MYMRTHQKVDIIHLVDVSACVRLLSHVYGLVAQTKITTKTIFGY